MLRVSQDVESRALTQWSCLSVSVQASQVDHIVVSCSLPMRCFMAGVEVRDKVEVLEKHSSVQLCAN